MADDVVAIIQSLCHEVDFEGTVQFLFRCRAKCNGNLDDFAALMEDLRKIGNAVGVSI